MFIENLNRIVSKPNVTPGRIPYCTTDSIPIVFVSKKKIVSKTSYMIIPNQKNEIDIRIRDSILTKVSTVKFHGVTLDEILTFNDSVTNVTTKISKSVGDKEITLPVTY